MKPPPGEEIAASFERAQTGDREAVAFIVQRYLPIVQGFMLGKAPQSEANDLAQDVLLSLCQELPKLRGAAQIGPWVMRVAANRLIDHWRYRSHRAGPTDGHALPGEPGAGEAVDGRPHPRAVAQSRQMLEALEQAMSTLSDKTRPVVFLSLWEERRSPEIAALLQLRESTVRMRLKSGLKQLRQELLRRGVNPPSGKC